jgi:hypothetical protein
VGSEAPPATCAEEARGQKRISEKELKVERWHVGQQQSAHRKKLLPPIVFGAMALPSDLEPPELTGKVGVTIAKILFSEEGVSITSEVIPKNLTNSLLQQSGSPTHVGRRSQLKRMCPPLVASLV